ncbi:hypothetical protein [Demequina rhizosphaerae]|uniref:hypothetical protein n=1 Tax=Demequina rhizosphaerae TaxID=1638985 RepID=UPI000783C759|nr:hypothetical protein [Demequina rhizosphaerae]
MLRKTLVVAAVAALTMMMSSPAGATSDKGQPGDNPSNGAHTETYKVVICHATASASNPYTVNDVSWNSIDNEFNVDWNGHGDHAGDIIPPFGDFPGQNWTTENEAIYDNGCKPVEEEPEVVTPDAPTWTDECGLDNAYWTVPGDTAAYTYAQSTDGGYLVVTATATTGHTFAGGETTMVWKGKDSGELCPPEEVTPEAPVWTDECGLDNAYWTVPGDTAAYTYAQSTDGGYLVVTATATTGHTFAGGETTMVWKDKDSGALCEEPPVDVCLNIDGIQTEVPDGYKADGQGNCCECTPPPVVDKCLNIDGDQATVPEGMTRDENGDCWTPKPPTKVEFTEWAVSDFMCESEKVTETRTKSMTTYTWDTATGAWVGTTTETVQEHTRAMTADESAELCPPPIDVCENLPGLQTELPEGLVMDEGDCLMPPEVTVSDWTGEPVCDMTSYTEWATETTSGYLPVETEGGYSWAPYVTYKTLYRTVEVDEVIPCDVEEPTEPTIDGTIVGEICTADAPYLGYDIVLDDPDGVSTDDGTATITFVHPTNTAKNWSTTVAIGTGKILWPGASVDEDGVANNWPGYKYSESKDEWVSVGAKNYGWTRADDTEVIISVNPSKTFTVSYPPATPVCNSEPPVEIVSVLDAPAATPVTGVATYTG